MESDRIKWNRRFASEERYLGMHPSPFLVQHLTDIKSKLEGLRALDIACGEGRNSLFLARHGFDVTGVDISDVGLDKGRRWAAQEGLRVDFLQADLEDYEFSGEFDLIINFNFLLRALIPKEVAALTPGGFLMFDSILESPDLLARHTPEYLLKRGELASLFSGRGGRLLHAEELEHAELPTARVLFQRTVPASSANFGRTP